jgi:predicted aspartyl protease
MFRSPGPAVRFLVVCAFLLIAIFSSAHPLWGVQCQMIQSRITTAADQAFLAGDYAKAESLYREELTRNPQRIEPEVGLVHSLLREQKLDEAAQAVNAAINTHPDTAELITLRGEVEYRAGAPWDATRSVNESAKLDPCGPRNMLLTARLARLSSLYATAQRSILLAHQLDPTDPEIRREWISTLPRAQREQELEAYLAKPEGLSDEELHRMQTSLEHLHKLDTESMKTCHLVSSATTTEIPFIQFMYDAWRTRGYGLNVKLNDHNARLEIDTGAGGLLVSRSVAQHAGLKPLVQTKVGGIGDEGDKAAYTAYADSIRIGNLEFQNCIVEVLDARRVVEDIDGLIGMDVLSRFLVTLDYPAQKLVLGPLPPRPGESTTPNAGLDTEDQGPGEQKATDQAQKPDKADDAQGGSSGADHEPGATSGATAKPSHGPYDRYIAPEMKDYTAVYRVGHDLILPTSVNGKQPKLFIMDTGAWSTTISPRTAREVTKVHRDWDTSVQGISGKVNRVYAADSITFQFANLSQEAHELASFDTSGVSKNLSLEISGFIGANTLRLLTIHIDYRDGLVKFDYDPKRVSRFGN